MTIPSNPLRRMPPASADSEAVWAFLEEGLDDIMANAQTIQFVRYMSLYTAAYNYCTSSRTQDPPNRNGDASDVLCSALYDKLVEYLARHVKGVKEQSDRLRGEALLRHYAGEWDRYIAGVDYIDRLFTYLNRFWVKPAHKQGRAGVYPICTLALIQWKSIFFLDGRDKLAGMIHRLIESERNGKYINRDHIKKVIDSLAFLDLDEIDVNKPSLEATQEHQWEPETLAVFVPESWRAF